MRPTVVVIGDVFADDVIKVRKTEDYEMIQFWLIRRKRMLT